jgi:hypothetical protein
MKRAKKEADERREMSGRMYRFWLKDTDKEGAEITFLDGDVVEDEGEQILDVFCAWEHTMIPHRGGWLDVLCVQKNDFADQEPCPLCEGGDMPAHIGYMTVLVHEDWKDRDGKVHEYRRRLFPAKSTVLGKLERKAKNEGGLAGCTFKVFRSGKRDFATGSDFDLVEKNDLEDVAAALEKPEHAEPADYERELLLLSADEMLERGIGGPTQPVVGAERPRSSRKAKRSRASDNF